jgi:transposase
MQRRHAISDAQWERIKDLLPGKAGDPGVTAKDNRLFIDAVLWIAKTGAPWRDLPERFGNWYNVWKRLSRWAKKGVWQRVFEVLQDPDLEWLILDSTVIRAHQHAAGAPKKTAVRKPKRWDAAAAALAPRSMRRSTASACQSHSC